MPSLKVKFYYTIRNCGDGSAAVDFHADEETAQLACDLEEEKGEPFGDNYPHSIMLEFNESGELLNPRKTREEIQKELDFRRSGGNDLLGL